MLYSLGSRNTVSFERNAMGLLNTRCFGTSLSVQCPLLSTSGPGRVPGAVPARLAARPARQRGQGGHGRLQPEERLLLPLLGQQHRHGGGAARAGGARGQPRLPQVEHMVRPKKSWIVKVKNGQYF